MIYAIVALLFFFFGHAMGRSACLDYYPARSAETAMWIVAQLRALVDTSRTINSAELVKYLDELKGDVKREHIKFTAPRSMRLPGSVTVGDKDHGPIAG